MRTDPSQKPWFRILVLVYSCIFLCLGFLVRFHFARADDCYWRAPDSYISIAGNLAQGRGFVDNQSNFGVPDSTRRPPLVPFVLSIFFRCSGKIDSLAGFFVFQSLIGAITALLVALLGWKLSNSLGVYLFLVPVYSFWAPAMGLAPCVMTETTFIFLFCSACLVLVEAFRKVSWTYFAAAGLLVGLASLARPILYPLYFLLAAAWPWLFAKKAKVSAKQKGIAAALFFAALLAVIFPWIQRNTNINGRFTLITSSVGLNLVMENSPASRPQMWIQLQEEAAPGGELSEIDETTRDWRLLDRAFGFIRQDPGRFAGQMIDRLIHVFNNSNDNFPELRFNVQWSTKWVFFLVIGLVVLFSTSFSQGLLMLLFELNFIAVYCLTYFEARFRETVMPVHLVLACIGGAYIIRKICEYRKRRLSLKRGA